MIVKESNGRLLAILQTDHADLSCQFAARWGNDRFSRPDPFEAVIRAAYEHDRGWDEWELSPTLDKAKQRPYDFRDLPHTSGRLRARTQSIVWLSDLDPYAGLLVAMHHAGLFKGRYGTIPAFHPRVGLDQASPEIRRFVAEVEDHQQRVRREIFGSSESKEATERLWFNYKLIQVFDILSLYFCCLGMPEYKFGPAPIAYSKSDSAEIVMRPVGEKAVSISPYPFAERSFRIFLRGRILPTKPYSDEAEFRRIFYEADRVGFSFEVRSP